MKKYFLTTKVLLGALVVIFLVMELLGGSRNVSTLLIFGAMTVEFVQAGQWWRLVTPMFLHIGMLHLCFNGFALYQLGPLCEQLFGPARFLLFFLLCGIAGNSLSYAMHDANIIAAGASGAIFGLVGCIIAAAWRDSGIIRPQARTALIRGLVPFVGYNFIFGLIIPNIDNWNHLGGLLAGAAIGYVAPLRRRHVDRSAYAWALSFVIVLWALWRHAEWIMGA